MNRIANVEMQPDALWPLTAEVQAAVPQRLQTSGAHASVLGSRPTSVSDGLSAGDGYAPVAQGSEKLRTSVSGERVPIEQY